MINQNLYRLLKRVIVTLTAIVLYAQTANAQLPLANFTSNRQTGCSPLSVNFQDLSSGSPSSWLWDFGNGVTSTDQNPGIIYNISGTYTIKLTVTNTSGQNTLTRNNYINVYESPSVDFSANQTASCFPHRVQFTDLSTAGTGNTNVSWLWDFNTGETSALKNPSITFNNTGLYSILLKVRNDKGCEKTFTKTNYINITPRIQSAFSNNEPAVCRPPVSISFTNNTNGPGTLSYLWNFGDGNTSTAKDPTHFYSMPGKFTVTLITRSTSGCVDTLKKADILTIGGITSTFTALDSVCANTEISFANNSSPAPLNSFWVFGDGTYSSQPNPKKTYTQGGEFNVILLNTYPTCTDVYSKKINIQARAIPDFSSADTIKCQPPLIVNFQNKTNGAISWLWVFGDGDSSTLQNPIHIYKKYGFYDVKLIVKNSFGCIDSIIKKSFIKIKRATIDIPDLPIEGCIPYGVNFQPTIQSLDLITSYSWNLGSGKTSFIKNPSVVYFTQSSNDIILALTSSTGCLDTFKLKDGVRVGTKPTANFSAAPNPVCAFSPILFTNLSTTSDKWIWNFGDGIFSTAQHPIINYPTLVADTITLITINFGCRDTIQKANYVTVLPPISKFESTPNCINRLEFSFSDKSSGPVTWLWNFGDGNTSTLQNPTHVFSTFKSYTISLTVTNGTCSHTSTNNITTIRELPNFVVSPLISCKPTNTSFSVLNVDSTKIKTYSWFFGNTETVNTTKLITPYTYLNSGTYDIRLITTDLNGCQDIVDKNNYITTYGPIAKFSATNTEGCKGFTTTFNDLSTPDAINKLVNWTWDFGDGTVKSFTAAPFQHVYNTTGTFSVKLIITDNYGCIDSITMKDIINATNPKAAFNSADTLSCPGSNVKFSNQSNAKNYSSLWTFGDNNTSVLQEPTHAYSIINNYTVKLNIIDQFGCKDSLTKSNFIKINKPVARFQVSDSASSCTAFQVRFTNNSSYFTKSKWDFGDSSSSSITNPVNYYKSSGVFYPKLLITSPGGCQDSISSMIQVFNSDSFSLDFSPQSGCKKLDIDFFARTEGPISQYRWDFGDGTTLVSTTPSVKHTYDRIGTYTPKLYYTDATGCENSVTNIKSILVKGSVPNFDIANTNQLCDSGMIRFNDLSIFNDPIISYSWNFGDGKISNLSTPSNKYLNPGFYDVSLKILTQSGCMDSVKKKNLIKVVQSPSIHITGDSLLCFNTAVQHAGNYLRVDTSLVTWNWIFPNGNSATQLNPSAQTYLKDGDFSITAVATNSSGCRDTAIKKVIVNLLPTSVMQDSITILAGNPVTLPITYSPKVNAYLWGPSAGLSCITCPKPDAVPKFTTTYSVLYTDSVGCKNKDTIQVNVLCKDANLFMPNTFSPNDDGRNDVFYPRGTGIYSVRILRVFNRWGELVFEKANFPANNASFGWNGIFKGAKPIQDVYIFQVEVYCENGQLIKQEGDIALIL